MGHTVFDQYSYLHFASGIICYFWGFSLKALFILHVIFELVENSSWGIHFINNNIYFWPGGKPRADAIVNQISDVIFSLIGWLSAYYIDKLGSNYNFYQAHLKHTRFNYSLEN